MDSVTPRVDPNFTYRSSPHIPAPDLSLDELRAQLRFELGESEPANG